MTPKARLPAPIASDQMTRIARLVQETFLGEQWIRDFIARIGLDYHSAQTLLDSENALYELRGIVAENVKRIANGTFLTEQSIPSAYGYHSGYSGGKTVAYQISILKQHDWGRQVNWELNPEQEHILNLPLPNGSEGYFVDVFDPGMVSDHEVASFDHSRHIFFALQALSKQMPGKVTNHRNSKFDPSFYRRHRKSAEKMWKLWDSQGCPTELILIPAQFGIRHRGKSVMQSRVMTRDPEFSLDAHEGLAMLLTHGNRLADHDDLWIDFPGSEYSKDGEGEFNHSLYMRVQDGGIRFDAGDARYARARYGSITGFLLQQ